MLGFLLLLIYFYSRSICIILTKQKAFAFVSEGSKKMGRQVIPRNQFRGRRRTPEKVWAKQLHRGGKEGRVPADYRTEASVSEGKEGLVSQQFILSLLEQCLACLPSSSTQPTAPSPGLPHHPVHIAHTLEHLSPVISPPLARVWQ